MDSAAWGALTLTLTLLGAVWTWVAFRRRGLASGLRAAAFTLLPAAAYLTRTLRLLSEIVGAVATWAAHLVFNPLVWVGVVLAGLSAVLFIASRLVRRRAAPARTGPAAGSTAAPGRVAPPAAPVDDDLAEIEALLRRRGIS